MGDSAQPRVSHFEGDRSRPLIDTTIGDAFQAVVKLHGERIALVVRHQRVRWTYRELEGHVNDLAAGLLRIGLRPGDRIGIWAPNCVEWTVTQYAAAKIGLVLVNLNSAYRPLEIKYALTKVGCKAVVFAHRYRETQYVDLLRSIAPEIDSSQAGDLRAAAIPELRHLICITDERQSGVHRFSDIAASGRMALENGPPDWPDDLHPSDPINIQFTSGTTGTPKAATLSHRGLLNNAWFTGAICQTTHDDAICVPLPLFHIFGMLTGNLLAMLRGAKIVHPGETFVAEDVLLAVEQERCTLLYGVPTMFVSMLAGLDYSRFDLSSLRGGIIAGAVVPMSLLRRVMTDLNMTGVVNGYGMTETSSAIMVTSPADTPERRVTSVGRVVPHVEAKIVDAQGITVPVGEPGEILARGYSTMLGYWNDPESTGSTIDPDGWIRTGDLGVFDEHGYGRIVGRIKEMVIRGGENISCGEIEDFLLLHPAVETAHVVGVPDDKYGEELCACVKVRPDARASIEEIREFCRGSISHFKIPRYVRFMDEFPLTSSGKVQKFALAKSSAEDLGLVRRS